MPSITCLSVSDLPAPKDILEVGFILMSPLVSLMAWIVSGLLPAFGQTVKRMESVFSCVCLGNPITSLRLKALEEAFASQ